MAEGEKCSYGPTLKKWLSNAKSWTKDVQCQNLRKVVLPEISLKYLTSYQADLSKWPKYLGFLKKLSFGVRSPSSQQ